MARSGSSQPRCEGGLEHGVFAGDLVGAEGDIEALAGGADDVEVGHGGLHQDHVGAFGDVEVDLAHGLAEVGAVHLIAAAVAELGGGVGGLAEGAVEGGGEFGGVAEDGRVGEQPAASSAARMASTRPSIMSLGATMSAPAWARRDGGAGEQGEGGVVVDGQARRRGSVDGSRRRSGRGRCTRRGRRRR